MTQKTLEAKVETPDVLDANGLQLRRELLRLINAKSVDIVLNARDLVAYHGKFAVVHYYDDAHEEKISMGQVHVNGEQVRIDFDSVVPNQFKSLEPYSSYPRFSGATPLNYLISKDSQN